MAILLYPIPYFILALVLSILFSYVWKIFPLTTTVRGPSWSWELISSVVYHSFLPALSIIVVTFGWWMLSMRALSATLMDEDFVVYAQLKGLSRPRILLRYVLPNAMLPQITFLALQLGLMFNGSIITEIVFNYPGLGSLIYTAILQGDYNLLMGTVIAVDRRGRHGDPADRPDLSVARPAHPAIGDAMTNRLILGSVIVGLVLLVWPCRVVVRRPTIRASGRPIRATCCPRPSICWAPRRSGQDTFWLLSWSRAQFADARRQRGGAGDHHRRRGRACSPAIAAAWLDRVLSFMMDALIVIPSLPLLILLSSMTKGQTSLLAVGIILVIFNWPFPARQIRAVALTMRERDFVNRRLVLRRDRSCRILWRQMVPYLRGWAVANFINTILVVVAIEASLAFLGLSNDNVPTIGTMIYWALKYQALIAGRWWWLLPPIISIILIFVGFFLVSNALADRLRVNPRGHNDHRRQCRRRLPHAARPGRRPSIASRLRCATTRSSASRANRAAARPRC